MQRTRTRSTVSVLAGSGVTKVYTSVESAQRYFQPKGEPCPGIATYTFSPHPGCLTPGKTGVSESMTDSKTSPLVFNDCTHVKVEWDCPLRAVKLRGSTRPPTGAEVVSEFNAGAADACEFAIDSWPFMASDALMVDEAASACNPAVVRPRFDAAVQVGEVLEGMHQIASLMKGLINVVQQLNALNRWKSPVVRTLLGERTFEELSMRDWAGLAIQSHLGWQFAIRPMIQLVRTFRKLNYGALRTLQSVVSEKMLLHGVSSRESEDSFTTFGTNQEYRDWGNTRSYRKEVHVTAEVQYHSLKTEALVRALYRSYLGSVPSLATAYELYPLSFVLDYFVNFGKVLAQWAETPIDDISYTVLWTGWSRKMTAKSEGWVALCDGWALRDYVDVEAPPLVTGTLRKTMYFREAKAINLNVHVPKPPEVNLPDASRWVAIAELAYAMRVGFNDMLRVAKAGRKRP